MLSFLSLFTSRWTYIILFLIGTHGALGWAAYHYAQYKGEAERLRLEASIDKANIEIMKRREAEYIETIERRNAAALADAKQLATDEEKLLAYDQQVKEMNDALSSKPDSDCLDRESTDRLRSLFDKADPGTGEEANP